jgi:hypothetical protein
LPFDIKISGYNEKQNPKSKHGKIENVEFMDGYGN